MKVVNVHEAKTHLSRLLDELARGADVTIAKVGKPVARLVPVIPVRPRRVPGLLRGKIRIAADFDAPLPPEILNAVEGAGEGGCCWTRRHICGSSTTRPPWETS